MSGFELGQRVAYSTHLQRRDTLPGEFNDKYNKFWSTHPGPGLEKEPWAGGEGIIVGKRQLSNGYVWWPYSEGGAEYQRAESFTAWLVAFDLNRKPVHVLPEHITALPEPAQAPENAGSVQPVLQ